MTQAELAKALGLSKGYVAKLCQEGLPKTMPEAKAWMDARKAGRHRKLPPVKPSARITVTPGVEGLTAGTLSYALAQHRTLVDRAREVYAAAIEANDVAQSKLQTAYNQSLRTLVQLEDEEKKRALEARTYIKLSEAQEIITRWTAKVVQRLDKLPLDCAESCNPDRPETAIKALEKWTLQARAELSSKTL
jgi:hypothetical protein